MYEVIVIGSGPSGIMASIFSGKRKKRTLLIEKNNCLGKKILASGGGRCNVTNLKEIKDLVKNYKNGEFLYNTLYCFSPKDIINYFEKELKVKLKEEDDNRIFPISNKSKTILEALEKELLNNNVEIKLEEILQDVLLNKDGTFKIKTDKGEYLTEKLVLAMGGKSYSNLGTDGNGYKILEKLGHSITELYPTQTPLESRDIFITEKILQGVSLENVSIKLNNKIVEGNFIFTHFGVSGSSVFRISEQVYYELKKDKELKISIDFLPEIKDNEILEILKKDITFFKYKLPKRLYDFLIKKNYIDIKRGDEISNKRLKELILDLKKFELNVSNIRGFDNSFLTGGGVNLKEIDGKSFESKKIKNLYVIGEILDIHGNTGGYNITAFLSMGFSVGKFI